MYRIDDATAATSLPAPEAAGTEGYFTEGNPATGTPATKVRGSWLNMIQEELRALVVAAGLAPSKTVYTQVRDASLALMLIASGMNCRLSYSAGSLTLKRYKGIYAYIPGQGVVTIPSGGVTLAPSGLTASTVYYIYLTLVSGTPTLIASTTGHTTDANTGIEVMTGDTTKLFVGIEYATGTTTWGGLCRSWYNDPGFSAKATLASSTSVNGVVNNVELSAALRVSFLCFADETVNATFLGTSVENVSGFTNLSGIGFDGTTPEEGYTGCQAAATNGISVVSTIANRRGLAEGFHYATPLVCVNGAFTGTWNGGATVGQRCVSAVNISSRK